MEEFKLAEIKHGRLAMLAMAGFTAQALVTQEGPWRNLTQHLAGPLDHNVLTSLQQPMGAVASVSVVAASAIVGGVAAAVLPVAGDAARRAEAVSSE